MNFARCHKNDWQCSTCKTIVYGNTNKLVCICGQTKYNSKNYTNKYTWRVGDKYCSNCKHWNFKSNTKCKFCRLSLICDSN